MYPVVAVGDIWGIAVVGIVQFQVAPPRQIADPDKSMTYRGFLFKG